MTDLRLHGLVPLSRANGPGKRFVIWVQGCTLGCPGCFNPDSHPSESGALVSIESLLEEIRAHEKGIEGVTISGGEPLQQRPALLDLLTRIRCETSLSVVLFSGYTQPEILKLSEGHAILAHVDILIAGRFVQSQRLARGLKGSANKTIHLLTTRYSLADFEQVPPIEIIINSKGDVIVSGIDANRLFPMLERR